MANKNKRRSRRRRTQGKLLGTKSRWKKARSFVPFGLVLGLLGVLPTLAAYSTRVSVEVSSQIDPTKPFSFHVTVSNEGTFPFEVEEWIFAMGDVRTSKGKLDQFILVIQPNEPATVYPGSKFDLMTPLDQMSTLIPPEKRFLPPGGTILSGNLRFGTRCRALWLFSQEQVFNFRAVVQQDGQTYWSPEPSFRDRSAYSTLRGATKAPQQ